MREVQATDAKTHLAQLLSSVERGETIAITRHEKPIAHLVPAEAQDLAPPAGQRWSVLRRNAPNGRAPVCPSRRSSTPVTKGTDIERFRSRRIRCRHLAPP